MRIDEDIIVRNNNQNAIEYQLVFGDPDDKGTCNSFSFRSENTLQAWLSNNYIDSSYRPRIYKIENITSKYAIKTLDNTVIEPPYNTLISKAGFIDSKKYDNKVLDKYNLDVANIQENNIKIDKDVLKILNESGYYPSLKELWQALLDELKLKLSDIAFKGLKASRAFRSGEIKLQVFKSVNPYAGSINGTVYKPIIVKLINYNSDIALFWSTETPAFDIILNNEQAVKEIIAKVTEKVKEKAQVEQIDLTKKYEIDKSYIPYTNYNKDTQDAKYIAAWALELAQK